MPFEFSCADVAFLTSNDGDLALAAAEKMHLDGPSEIRDMVALGASAGEFAGAVAETVRLRRRAIARWTAVPGFAPEKWLFTDTALQQASPPAVARYRADQVRSRLMSGGYDDAARSCVVHDVTCSIGTDLVALASVGLAVAGSDIDPIRLAMAHHNLSVAGVVAPLLHADACAALSASDREQLGLSSCCVVRYADPERRDVTGRRISGIDTIPPVADLDAVRLGDPAVLRLPPGIDYERLGRAGDSEIVSLDGAVREALSWPALPGAGAAANWQRRATVLISDRGSGDDAPSSGYQVAEQLTDRDPDDAAVGEIIPGRFVVDPDPAVVRAHLVRRYATRYSLDLIDPHLAYLVGDTVPPGVRGFAVVDVAPYSEKTIRSWLRRDRVGTLEIKQRGTDIVPDRLRRRLRPRGDRRIQRTLIVARVASQRQALWCCAVPASRARGAGHTVTG